MSSRKSRCSRKYKPCNAKDSLSINKVPCTKSLFVHRTYILFIFSTSSKRLYSCLGWLSDSHNSYIIVAVAISVQLDVVVVVVVVQLLHIYKFFFEVVCSLIINYTELYYFKRGSITHKVFFSFLY
jgi:hypothetical protein